MTRDLTDTVMLRSAVGCKTLTLTEGKRAGPQLFAWISTMTPQNGRKGPRQNLFLALWAARRDFPARGQPSATNVCLTHRTRMRVCKMAQALRLKRERPKEYLTLEGEPPLGQRLHLWPGVPLIACVQQTKDGIYNSMLLEVTGYDGETISLRDREGDGEFKMSHDWVRKHTRSGYCYTIASAQGRTIPGDIGIYDTSHKRFSRRHLYTCLSRAQRYADISIED